jgi:hypothetical protein
MEELQEDDRMFTHWVKEVFILFGHTEDRTIFARKLPAAMKEFAEDAGVLPPTS